MKKLVLVVLGGVVVFMILASLKGTPRQPSKAEMADAVAKIWASCEAEYPEDAERLAACFNRMSDAYVAGVKGTPRQPSKAAMADAVAKIWASCEAEYPKDSNRKVECADRMAGSYLAGVNAGR